MSQRPIRRPRRGRVALLAGVGALVVAISSIGIAGVADSAPSKADQALEAAATPFHQGVYVGAADPSGVATFDAQTGTYCTIAGEFLPASSGWAGMDGSGGSLSWMFAQGWSGTRYTLSLGVPMIPKDPSGDALGTLAIGATGAYNGYFTTLAQTLIGAGEGNAYLRLGWEFDGGVYAWSATTPSEEADFATYFQQIVTTMRAVPGANFKFVWNPEVAAFNDAPYDVTLAYPGNAYVDYIGLDAYDQSWATPLNPTTAWNETLLPDLQDAHSFAASVGKPLAIPEWGIAIRTDGHGLGDDPLYINNFVDWIKNPANDVAYESYFDANADGVNSAITGGQFPNSLSAFESQLGLFQATISIVLGIGNL